MSDETIMGIIFFIIMAIMFFIGIYIEIKNRIYWNKTKRRKNNER